MPHLDIEELMVNTEFQNIPHPRYGHSMVKTSENEFYVFGGHISFLGMRCNDLRCNEMWKFNIEEETWELVSTGTPNIQ